MKKTTTQQKKKLGGGRRRRRQPIIQRESLFLFINPYLEILDAHAARALVIPEALRVEPVDLDSLHLERGPKAESFGDLLSFFSLSLSLAALKSRARAGAPGALLRARGHARIEGEGGEPCQTEREKKREKTSSLLSRRLKQRR